MSNFKKIVGDVELAPYLKKETTQVGKTKIDDKGIGLDIYSKFGTIGLSAGKQTQESGSQKVKTKSKGITYGKNIKLGKNSSLTIEGNIGKSKNQYQDTTTKGGKITFRKKFRRGGDVMPARNKKNFRPTEKGAGMTAAGVAAYRRANPGSKLKTAVTGKVKKGSKAAKRRKSYCARSLGQLKRASAKTRNDPNSRIRQARRRWKC